MKVNIIFPNHAKLIMGGYKVLFEYANYFAENGIEVHIYYLMSETLKRRKVPKILYKPFIFFMSSYYPRWFKFNHNIKRKGIININEVEDADIIFASEVRTAEPVNSLPLCKGKKIYFIQDYESWLVNEDYLHKTYKYPMHIITISQWLSDIVDQYAKYKTICIKDGIDGKIFYNRNYNRRNHSIVFHYRPAENKGGDISIAVIKKLKNIYPDLSVDVITSDKKINMPSFVNIHYRISPDKVAEIDNNNNVFLCTSRKEGYGLPGLEAMACGCALVSTAYRGVMEYAINGENSLLAPLDDVDELVRNICRLFNDKILRDKIVKGGLKTADELDFRNSAKVLKDTIVDIYNE